MLEGIKSKYIMNIIFNYIKNQEKLNIIRYNKRLLSNLNITKEDFENIFLLNKLNKQYNIDIEDVNITKISLSSKELDKYFLEDFIKIKFKNLQKLYLNNNDIFNIKSLAKANLSELIELDISNNYGKMLISKGLDISIFEKINLKKLEKLNISGNKIKDITVLEKVNFSELKELNLSDNYIKDIDVLEKVNFKKLEILDLSFTEIEYIRPLEKANFKELKELNISHNIINDIYIYTKKC